MAPKPKLTDAQIAEIRFAKGSNPAITRAALAKEYGVGETTIQAVLQAGATATGVQPNTHHTPTDPAIVMVARNQIILSPLNPRKTFDVDALAEFAENVAEQGVLQNLIIRKHPDFDGRYWLVGGERRCRAIDLLVDAERWNLDEVNIPARIVETDDAGHITLAIIENLQREDVSPIDEADAFVQLQAIDKTKFSTANIATKIGKSTRYVQQRISLSTKLAAPARQLLVEGKINIEGARLLATVSHEQQVQILDYEEGDKIDTQHIRWAVCAKLICVDDAIFDVAASGLETIEDEDNQYFTDTKAVIAAQMKAVKAVAKKLEKEWAWVKQLPVGDQFFARDYLTGKTAKGGAGAFIEIGRDYSVKITTGLLKRPSETPAPSKPQIPSVDHEALTKAQAERDTEKKSRFDKMNEIVKQLPTDYSPEERAGEQAPNCEGCKYNAALGYPHNFDGWLVCINPESPRAGLLTHEHQAGRDCFVAEE